jgi:hypothetical protein
MKSIAQVVQDGINNLNDLQDALQTAMLLELCTIPPYLCAQWSIIRAEDPSKVSGLIRSVVMQEMAHFAMTGNMLTAIRGTPAFANAASIQTVLHYPSNELPGGIAQQLAIDLLPFSLDQLRVFMQIECPEFAPVAVARLRDAPATIGAFYSTISAGFDAVKPDFNGDANIITDPALPEVGRITDVAGAQGAITTIKQEGEGTSLTPQEPSMPPGKLAHYYVFEEILCGRKLVQNGDCWAFAGDAIQLPGKYPFARSQTDADGRLAFNRAFTKIMVDLEACWTKNAAFDFSDMDSLQGLGVALIREGVCPEFQWVA